MRETSDGLQFWQGIVTSSQPIIAVTVSVPSHLHCFVIQDVSEILFFNRRLKSSRTKPHLQ